MRLVCARRLCVTTLVLGFTNICDNNDCDLPGVVFTKRSLDRLNGGHTMVAKRSSLDRLGGNLIGFADLCDDGDCSVPSLPAKRSVNRSDGGYATVAKRSSLDRLDGNLIGLVDSCNGIECGLPDGTMATGKWSLDRLNGGHTMVAKRSLDLLNGGHTMVAKRSLDRLNSGGHTLVDRSASIDGPSLAPWSVIALSRSDVTRSTIDRLGTGGPVFVRQPLGQKPRYRLRRRTDSVESEDGEDYFVGDYCLNCSSAQSSF